MELIEEYLRKRIETLKADKTGKEITRHRLWEVQQALKVYLGETDEFIQLALEETL